jgi:hypothetical protein
LSPQLGVVELELDFEDGSQRIFFANPIQVFKLCCIFFSMGLFKNSSTFLFLNNRYWAFQFFIQFNCPCVQCVSYSSKYGYGYGSFLSDAQSPIFEILYTIQFPHFFSIILKTFYIIHLINYFSLFQASLIMHLTEIEKDEGMSISELAEKCEVEKEVVQSQMTFWIAKGVIRQRRGGAPHEHENIKERNDSDNNTNNENDGDTGLNNGSGNISSSNDNTLIRISSSEDNDDEVHFFLIEEQAERALRDKEERPGGMGGTDEDLGLVIPDLVIHLFFFVSSILDDVKC